MDEKRSYQRLKVDFNAHCKPLGTDDTAYSAITIMDISPRGIAFLSKANIEPGIDLELKILLSTNDTIRLQVKVIRSNFIKETSQYKISAKITEGNESDKNILIRFYCLKVRKR